VNLEGASARRETFLGQRAASGFVGSVAGLSTAILLALIAPASALAAPVLQVGVSHVPPAAPVPAGTYAVYKIYVFNAGDAPTTEAVTAEFTAPAGLEVTAVSDEIEEGFGIPVWDCAIAADSQAVSCTGPEFEGVPLSIGPGKEACVGELGEPCSLLVTLKTDPNLPPGSVNPTVQACGGGALACADGPDNPLLIVPLQLSLTEFDGDFLTAGGAPEARAGAHPHIASTEFFLGTFIAGNGLEFAVDDLKDSVVELPPGFVENPLAAPTCSEQQLLTLNCPPAGQIGTATIWYAGTHGTPGNPVAESVGVYNMTAPQGVPALFGFNVEGAPIHLDAELRTGGDYGITVKARNIPQVDTVVGVTFKLWGVPADPGHDAERYCIGTITPGCASGAPREPFISLPTSCLGPLETSIAVEGWLGGEAAAGFLSHDNEGNPIGAKACDTIDFSPSLEARPTTDVADAPSGLDADLHVPQNDDPDGTASAHLKDATVTLPQGLVVNPSGADGLAGCAPAEADLNGSGPAHCPDASKLGTVEIETPLVAHPLPGGIYLADPYDNPFDSLLALYLAVEDQQSGIVMKLAGRVIPDLVTGRLSATFEESPQLPFEDLRLHFFGGAGGALRTPALCGTYSTISVLTPWSAPDSGSSATPSDAYAIQNSPSGGTCPQSTDELPSTPSLDAGTVSPVAGASSRFVISLGRAAGTQGFDSFRLAAPPGLIASLAGIPYCPESALAAISSAPGTARTELDDSSCPANSRVGTISVGAGAGPQPLFLAGKVYLSGPYKGAPISLAVLVPVLAGPFDLGTVALRIAVHVDPDNAQLRLTSDSLPSILHGIPLDVRRLHIDFDRPEFARNPTSCDPTSIAATATSTQGAVVDLSERFQVGGCGGLGLRPRFDLRFSGGIGRNGHPALTALLRPRTGDANLEEATMILPRGALIDPGHLAGVCTKKDFAVRNCSPGSVRGRARAWSPALEQPLEGPIYLRESTARYPDLAVDLDGQVRLALLGQIQTPDGSIRARFDSLPDVPLNRLKLLLEGGKRGLLVNSEGLCRIQPRARVAIAAHNGVRRQLRARVTARPCPRSQGGRR
jgi:hypothetical protein